VDAPAEITDFFFSRTFWSDMTFKKKNEDYYILLCKSNLLFFSGLGFRVYVVVASLSRFWAKKSSLSKYTTFGKQHTPTAKRQREREYARRHPGISRPQRVRVVGFLLEKVLFISVLRIPRNESFRKERERKREREL